MKPFKQLNIQTSADNMLVLTLPRFGVLALVVILLVNALLISVKASEIAAPAGANPFAGYIDVFPGQPRGALTELGFTCPASSLTRQPTSVGETCVFWTTTAPFYVVRVYVLNDMIRQTEFVMYKRTLTLGLPAGETSVSAASNPFADYIDVFPGQPRSALEELGFSCPASYLANLPDAAGETCVLWSATGLFSQVRVYVVQDVIQNIDFVMR